ncbi:MAG TPA: hypothetical protein VI821_00405 [Candidatus Paceibacterota bacterium]
MNFTPYEKPDLSKFKIEKTHEDITHCSKVTVCVLVERVDKWDRVICRFNNAEDSDKLIRISHGITKPGDHTPLIRGGLVVKSEELKEHVSQFVSVRFRIQRYSFKDINGWKLVPEFIELIC